MFVPVWFCVVKTMLVELSFEFWVEVFETHSDSPQYGRSLNRRASKQSQGLPSCLLGTLGGEPEFKNIHIFGMTHFQWTLGHCFWWSCWTILDLSLDFHWSWIWCKEVGVEADWIFTKKKRIYWNQQQDWQKESAIKNPLGFFSLPFLRTLLLQRADKWKV